MKILSPYAELSYIDRHGTTESSINHKKTQKSEKRILKTEAMAFRVLKRVYLFIFIMPVNTKNWKGRKRSVMTYLMRI